MDSLTYKCLPKPLVIIIYLFTMGLFFACESMDLAFINKMKRFEPQWMTLSEELTFLDRNLNISANRYQRDLELIEQKMEVRNTRSQKVLDQRADLKSLILERDRIQTEFDALKETFTAKVYEFNEWQNQVMKNNLSLEDAERDFTLFQEEYNILGGQASKLRDELLTNLTSHNVILRQLSEQLKMYTNFDIVPK